MLNSFRNIDMKRKRQDTTERQEGPAEVAGAFTKIDEPTLLYFKEIRGHLDEADEEQRSALASTALLEANGWC